VKYKVCGDTNENEDGDQLDENNCGVEVRRLLNPDLQNRGDDSDANKGNKVKQGGNLISFIGIAIVTTILVNGIKESANFNTTVVFIKLVAVLIFIGVAATYVLGHKEQSVTNWTPFIPPNAGTFGDHGWSGILRAAGVVFFAYIGFDAVSTAAQEAKNPQKDMPIGILGSLAICTVLY